MYLEYRRRKWAAGVIAISWIMHIKMAKVRHQLKQARLDNLESFRKRAKVSGDLLWKINIFFLIKKGILGSCTGWGGSLLLYTSKCRSLGSQIDLLKCYNRKLAAACG